MTSPITGMTAPTFPYGVKGHLWLAGFHTGQDYACRAGTSVLATKSGIVVGVGDVWGPAYGGHQVIIESRALNGTVIRHGYMHMRKAVPKVGFKVVAGQVVGFVGEEGNATGPHLHYEERKAPFRYNDVVRRPLFPGLRPALAALIVRPKGPPLHSDDDPAWEDLR